MARPLLWHVDVVRKAILRARKDKEAPSVQYLYGPPTVGKSVVLHMLPAALTEADDDLRPIVVTAPVGMPDAAAAVASQLTGQLAGVGVLDKDQLAELQERRVPWTDKIELLRGVLDDPERSGNVVLLLDEPRTWRPDVGGPFTAQVEQLYGLLVHGVRQPRVIATSRAPQKSAIRAVHVLPTGNDHRAWLLEDTHWGPLADSAAEVAERYGKGLDVLTPLQARLTVTLGHLDDFKAIERALRDAANATPLLCGRVVDHLLNWREQLAEVLDHLRLVRRSFDDRLLQSVEAPGAGSEAGTLLRNGVLFGDEGQYVLHDAMRLALDERLGHRRQHHLLDAHRHLAGFYEVCCEAAWEKTDVSARLNCEVEAFWHATAAGVDDAYERLAHRFTVQALLYGTVMYRYHERPDVAERVFTDLIDQEQERAYAVHHYAFLRDRLARDPQSVETGYRHALELDDGNALWHARLILFLLDQGAAREARAAWRDALAAPLNADERAESRIADLHRPVLERLLRTGEIEFAQAVLAEVDSDLIERDPGLRILRLRLDALIEAERYGAVRPYALLREGWWHEDPRHLLRDLGDGHSLSHWWAARVKDVDQEGVSLEFAEVADGDEPRSGTTRVGRDVFERAIRDVQLDELRPGRFLEIGFYRNGTPDIARVMVRQVRTESTLEALPESELDPQRYRAAAGLVEE